MVSHSRSFARAAFALFALGAVVTAFAQPESVGNVSGKEYTDLLDKNSTGAISATQSLLFNGTGGVADGRLYGAPGEVDAMAASFDAYFGDVLSNSAALLFSVKGDNGGAPIRYELPGGGNGVWATVAQVDSNGVNDLDALEVWGPDGVPDGDMFSLFGDGGGVAVWNYNGGSPVAFATTAEIASAIGLAGVHVDLDALMVFGDTLLFSIRAIGGYDGGEIFVYTLGGGSGPATFLNHGGHLWDTAFDVGGTFGCPTDEIDALEAVNVVPEPASMAALAIGAGALLRRRNRKA